MSKPKTASAKVDSYDGLPVLIYQGDESGDPHIAGIPARDLHGGDLHRLAGIDRRTRRHAQYEAEGIEPDTEAVSPEDLRDELVKSGLYAYATEDDRTAASDEVEEVEAEQQEEAIEAAAAAGAPDAAASASAPEEA